MKLTSWPAAIQSYLDALRARAYSKQTIQTRQATLLRFARQLRGRHDVRRVSGADVAAYAYRLARKKTRYGRPCSLLTQRLTLEILRGFFAYLLSRKLILLDPTREIALPRADSLPRSVPSEAQARRLMNAPDRQGPLGLRDRAILELLYGSALRASELRAVRLTDLDLERRTLFVRLGKGGKDRTVPLSGRSVLALGAYLAEARPRLVKRAHELALFLSQEGTPLGKSILQARVKRYVEEARLPAGTCLHSLRHACATHLLQGGANLRHVQAILGHAHLQSTAVYTRVNVRDLAQVLERAHPRERAWRRRRAR